MKNKLFWSITVALAGFLFGFDTVVISGANEPIKALWNTAGFFHGFFIMSMALWGTVFGAIFGGIPTDKFGRKKTLIWIGLLFFISAIGSALAQDPYTFSLFRFIGGLGVGASSVAAPTYITEISTKESRGSLVALYQFNIVLGIFIAFFSNYGLQDVGGINDWRYMLGVEAIPAAIYTLFMFSVPESPRWLIVEKKEMIQSKKILMQIYQSVDLAEKQIKEIINLKNTEKEVERLFQKKYTKPILLAFFLAFFNQVSGINFILYYAPELLANAGLAAKDSLANSIWIGGINLVFTLLGMYLIDKRGRRELLTIGSIGYIISLVMVSICFFYGLSSNLLLFFILMFISSHAVGQGAVIWVYISEIFPTKVRAAGQAFGSSVHWVFAAIIALVGTPFLDAAKAAGEKPWFIFSIFAFFMMLQLLFALFKFPETRGKSLEAIEKEMVT